MKCKSCNKNFDKCYYFQIEYCVCSNNEDSYDNTFEDWYCCTNCLKPLLTTIYDHFNGNIKIQELEISHEEK